MSKEDKILRYSCGSMCYMSEDEKGNLIEVKSLELYKTALKKAIEEEMKELVNIKKKEENFIVFESVNNALKIRSHFLELIETIKPE